MDSDTVWTYEYTDADFIHQTAPWVDSTAPQLSKFDQELHRRWDQAMKAGFFRYDIDHIITRILPGPKHYVGQLNTLRATERRKPQDIGCVNQPFNEKAFNFTWVKEGEVIFNMRKARRKKTAAQNTRQYELNNGSVGVGYNGHVKDGASCDHSNYINGELSSASSVISEFSSSGSEMQPACTRNAPAERHTMIINVSPMEYGHCLLLPQIDSHKPQVLTQTALQVAIETMLLSRHRGLRMGFNSLCAFASVNHLHFHVYYLEHELIVDYSPVHHLGGKYFEFTGIPCPGFAVQLHGTTVAEMARLVHKISSYFQKEDIAHNVYIVRGCVFGEERSSSLTTVRLFIWPRRKFIGEKSSEEFNVACIELGGHLPIKEVDGYHKLTEADVDAIIEDACLPPEQYESVRQVVVQMGLEEEETSHQKENF